MDGVKLVIAKVERIAASNAASKTALIQPGNRSTNIVIAASFAPAAAYSGIARAAKNDRKHTE